VIVTMPRRAAHPCSQRGCPELVHDSDERYCAEHKALHQAEYDAGRGTAAQRGYDAAWQQISADYLAEHPICQRCGRTQSALIHHVVSKRRGGNDDDTNLRALCRLCHAQVHAAQEGLFRRLEGQVC
jgi:5-methylcytosine-specific restriction protein A